MREKKKESARMPLASEGFFSGIERILQLAWRENEFFHVRMKEATMIYQDSHGNLYILIILLHLDYVWDLCRIMCIRCCQDADKNEGCDRKPVYVNMCLSTDRNTTVLNRY